MATTIGIDVITLELEDSKRYVKLILTPSVTVSSDLDSKYFVSLTKHQVGGLISALSVLEKKMK